MLGQFGCNYFSVTLTYLKANLAETRQQATDDRMSYQATHGQSLPTANYPNKSSGRY
jgi:hypothetical protein